MITVTVPECGTLPRGYAVAYWRPTSLEAVCLPIGLHWVVSMARAVYGRVARARVREAWEALAADAYRRGYQQGYTIGMVVGVRDEQQRIMDTFDAALIRQPQTRTM